MPNKIQIKRTSVTGRTPNTTSSGNSSYIDAGELAINITDGKLFSSDGSIYFEVGGNLQSLSVTSGLTANSTLVNAVALNVVNQTNTATLYVTTSANVGTSLTVNSIAINAAVNTSIRAIIANGSIGSDGQVLISNATGIYWGTVTGGSISNYSANIGNGSATSITVTHNLNKENVIATVRENSSGYYVYPDIKYSTTNTTVLEFVDAPTTDQYKVIVIGV